MTAHLELYRQRQRAGDYRQARQRAAAERRRREAERAIREAATWEPEPATRSGVPRPGEEGTVLLGPIETRRRVTVLGCVRIYRVCRTTCARAWVLQKLVRVQVHGEDEPRDVAVERFVEEDE